MVTYLHRHVHISRPAFPPSSLFPSSILDHLSSFLLVSELLPD